jgi:hypothetical protein
MDIFGGRGNRTMRLVAGLLISTLTLFCSFTQASADLRYSRGMSQPGKPLRFSNLSPQWHPGLKITPPPTRWDHAFVGDVIEKDLPSKEAKDLCFKMGNREAEACAGIGTYTTGEKKGQRICIIVMPTDDLHGTVDQYRRHEIAHCNGWNQSHSN